jgi:hypothetical protein
MKIDVKYLISILAFILAGLSGWILLSIVELKEFTRMMNGELLQIDKQIGRVYNYINSNMK